MIYRIERIEELSDETRSRLTNVWEKSVTATHDFLSVADIAKLRPLVRESLSEMDYLICVKDADDAPLAFIGIVKDKIEMLFVHPDFRRMGLGKTLMSYAMSNLNAKYVDVNEQNKQGLAFYECIGFKVFSRSETDSQGAPFPILHMEKIK